MRIEILTLTNIHLDIQQGILVIPLFLYLASLQDQPPAAYRWSDIIFDMRIEILTLINLHLDIQQGILVIPLFLYLAGLQDQPPAASSGLQVPRFYFFCQN